MAVAALHPTCGCRCTPTYPGWLLNWPSNLVSVRRSDCHSRPPLSSAHCHAHSTPRLPRVHRPDRVASRPYLPETHRLRLRALARGGCRGVMGRGRTLHLVMGKSSNRWCSGTQLNRGLHGQCKVMTQWSNAQIMQCYATDQLWLHTGKVLCLTDLTHSISHFTRYYAIHTVLCNSHW